MTNLPVMSPPIMRTSGGPSLARAALMNFLKQVVDPCTSVAKKIFKNDEGIWPLSASYYTPSDLDDGCEILYGLERCGVDPVVRTPRRRAYSARRLVKFIYGLVREQCRSRP